MFLFRTFILRRIREEKLRALATVLGVALGIAVVLAVRMANQSSVRSFETALETVAGKTSLEIVGSGSGLREERLLELDWLEQFGQISPVIEGEARASFPSGEREWLKILGVDILRDETLRDYRLVRFANRQESPAPREFLELLSDPGAIVLTQKLARRHNLDPGSGLVLDIGDRREVLTVRGLLLDRGPARALNGTFALMDIAAAQWLLGRLGRIDRVDLRLKPEISIDRAEAAIAARLPEGLTVQRPSRRGRQVEKMLEAFHFNLTALSHIALLVGLFLIYNTVSLSVITRRREVGILRAVGGSRRQVAGLFLAEAGLLAALGCALGVLLGGWMARGALRLTGATLDRLYIRSAAEPVALGPEHLVLAFAVGIPLALLAALVPALEASRVAPTEAVQRRRPGREPFPLELEATLASSDPVDPGCRVRLPGFGRRRSPFRLRGLPGHRFRGCLPGSGRAASFRAGGLPAHQAVDGGGGPAGQRQSQRVHPPHFDLGGGPGGQPFHGHGHHHHDRQLPGDGPVLGRADAEGRSLCGTGHPIQRLFGVDPLSRSGAADIHKPPGGCRRSLQQFQHRLPGSQGIAGIRRL